MTFNASGTRWEGKKPRNEKLKVLRFLSAVAKNDAKNSKVKLKELIATHTEGEKP